MEKTSAAISLHRGLRSLLTCRFLSANHIRKLVCVQGIVTRCSLKRPKVKKTVHYCAEEKRNYVREYHDATSLDHLPTRTLSLLITLAVTYMSRDQQDHPVVTEYGLSVYRDHQTIGLQEMPEHAPPGQLPRSIEVILDGDLVDTVKPGDRVRVGLIK